MDVSENATETGCVKNTVPSQNPLGTAPIRSLVFKMAIPTIIAQLVNLLYSIVDRIFVGHMPGVGSDALAGLGVTFPVVLVICAFSQLIGMGGGPRASIALGEKKYDHAESILGNCVTMLCSMAVILTVVFFIFKNDILLLFGANAQTLSYGSSYLGIYLLGTIPVMLTFGLNVFITNQGFSRISMLTVCIGAALNLILDPIFIFGFGLGVEGAAIATVISQTVSAIWVMTFLCGKKAYIHIRLSKMKLHTKTVVSIFSLGISPFVMTITDCVIQLNFNRGMLIYGSSMYVAIMSILFSINQIIFNPAQGFGQGVQPIIGFNYGAAQIDRVKKTFKIVFIYDTAFCTLLVLVAELFPGFIIGMFSNDPTLIESAITPMRIFIIGLAPLGMQCACQLSFVAMGQAGVSVFIAVLRKVILLLPLILILPHIGDLGIWGLMLAEPISDTLSATTSVILYKLKSPKMYQKALKSNKQLVDKN